MCTGKKPLLQNHFKFRRVKKKLSWQNTELSELLIKPNDFVKNYKGFIQNPTKLVQLSAKPLGLIRNPDSSEFCHKTFFSTLYTVKKMWRIINGETVFDALLNGKKVYEFATYNTPLFVYEVLKKRKKRFIIRCKFIKLNFFSVRNLERFCSNGSSLGHAIRIFNIP